MNIVIEDVCSGQGVSYSNLVFSDGSSQFCLFNITNDKIVDIVTKLESLRLEKFGSLSGGSERVFCNYIKVLDRRCIQKVLRDVRNQDLAVALKGVDDVVREVVFANMSKRAVGMLKEDMEYMLPISLRDVEEAQKKIISVILHLEDTGEIIINKDSLRV